MNAVEIEQAISELAEAEFDAAEFPFQFLEAFGNKATTIKKLRAGSSNSSDVGGVLQRNNIHIKVAAPGQVTATLGELRSSPATTKAKAKFILATDGRQFEAEDLATGDVIACNFSEFPDHFGVFLPLAGISTVKQIRESTIDIRATSKLNRLYVELLKENPDWGTEERRHDMNHFMARLIFCFFAEDTGIFNKTDVFTDTVEQMSERDASNTHEILAAIFAAMNTHPEARRKDPLPRWADAFPYVNGGLFSGSTDTPRFSRHARSLFIHVGSLDWQKINPDIFGSMIQAVADDEERGALGMHYTSVPNILKVLNPLFLDDLREQLDAAGENARKLLNLRNRMAKIRVFDPACGSGNFLVIAYKEMRAIEAEINQRRGEADRASDIPLTNFRGIELRDFAAEIARLALIIAEYQCDVLWRGQKEALADFLPLDAKNWITCGNALRLDWLSICPPTGTGVKVASDDLFETPLDQAEIDFENEGGETFICGNPPYLGNKLQNAEQKSDLAEAVGNEIKSWRSLDYVAGWLLKAAKFIRSSDAEAALVCTSSICQGQPVPILWPIIFAQGCHIHFAHQPFSWSNLASNAAVVTVIIVGLSKKLHSNSKLYSVEPGGGSVVKSAPFINAYLINGPDLIVEGTREPINGLAPMVFGNMPRDGGNLLMTMGEKKEIEAAEPDSVEFLRLFLGSEDVIHGSQRACIWVSEEHRQEAEAIDALNERFQKTRENRRASKAQSTQDYANKPFRFVQIQGVAERHSIIVPRHSSELRPYLPVAAYDAETIVADSALALYDVPLWNLALITSRLHLVWIAAVCGKLETRIRYSNTLGWNTFPISKLTEKNKADLTRCAEDILLAREAHFPATIADLYDPEKMPGDLRAAHDRNDEVLERIYIGRRFRNDTERLEKLFELYTKMTSEVAA